jgi:HEAT repeat protein
VHPQNRQLSDAPQGLALLPTLPSLEHLKKQAKALAAACRMDDAGAAQRMRRWFPAQEGPPRLTHAQLVIAREYGFASWTRLRQAVLQTLVDRLAVRPRTEWRAAAAARAALAQAGEAGRLAVLEGLWHPAPRVRRGAVDFLNRYAGDRCAARLTELALHDPVPYVRWSALQALTPRPRPSPVPAGLRELLARVALEDPSPRVRRHAVGALDAAHLVRVIQEDSSPRVRSLALAVLGRRPPGPLVRETLEAALRDPHPEVRWAAHQALRRHSPEYRHMVVQRAREANPARAGRPAAPA